jgi:hypothetical protein
MQEFRQRAEYENRLNIEFKRHLSPWVPEGEQKRLQKLFQLPVDGPHRVHILFAHLATTLLAGPQEGPMSFSRADKPRNRAASRMHSQRLN